MSDLSLNSLQTKIDNIAVVASGIPVGFIGMWSGSALNIPTGWTLCDGTNGAPDLRNRFILGAGSTYTVGAVGGEETHKLTVAEMPSHTHQTGIYVGGSSGGSACAFGNSVGPNAYITNTSSGSNGAHNNMPPYFALCFIMKL
jgi:microcystin-dependent protein